MPGRMGGNTRTSQSLHVLKTDASEGLVYVAGVVPGSKGAFVRVRDAVRRCQDASCFPTPDADVPYPTCRAVAGWEEAVAPEPVGAAVEFDPMLRVANEK